MVSKTATKYILTRFYYRKNIFAKITTKGLTLLKQQHIINLKLLIQQQKGRGDGMGFKLDYIRERRKKLGISMKQMANVLGFKNASTYLKYERGDYSFRAEHLPVLADQLECDVSDFFNQSVAESATIEICQAL